MQLDAGWFVGGFPNGVGNWQLDLTSTVDSLEFPGATLAPLAVASHAEPNPVQVSVNVFLSCTRCNQVTVCLLVYRLV